MMVTTPFNEKREAILIKEYESLEIIREYARTFNMDVSTYFKGIPQISLYECPVSKIRFFIPASVMGDSSFYEKLQVFDWYYMDWKWEQKYVYDKILPDDKVLEIGCGNGTFVERLTKKKIAVLGIEMNQHEVESCRAKGLNVTDQSLDDLLVTQAGTYTMICAFQVFEHLPDLDGIIRQSLQLLKPGGKLIFSVPNMEAFIRYNEGGPLNKPPHHVNWFYKATFNYISDKYGLPELEIVYEPLQSYHYNWYAEYIKARYLSNRIFNRLFYTGIMRKVQYYLFQKMAHTIKGHSIMAIYTKPL